MTAQQAIDQSIATDSIVTLDDADDSTVRDLLAESDDSVENGTVYEFWGRNDDGATWRVHVRGRRRCGGGGYDCTTDIEVLAP